MKDELWKLGACETANSIREGKLTCLEVVQASVDRLLQVNPEINAVTVNLTDEALISAKEADAALLDGIEPGPLYGVPITLKENINSMYVQIRRIWKLL